LTSKTSLLLSTAVNGHCGELLCRLPQSVLLLGSYGSILSGKYVNVYSTILFVACVEHLLTEHFLTVIETKKKAFDSE
jgi:hypothetical protein